MNIHSTAIISPDAQLEEGVEIGPYVVIGSDVKIGKNTVIGPHTVAPGFEIWWRKDPCNYRQLQYHPGICNHSPRNDR